jgi:antitoxin component YwqK of YwqJK toxin-antitoxin module
MEEGKGVMLTPDGIRFEGSFKQGKKHGPFVETDKDGKIVRKGVYKFGTLDVAQK